jgi:Ran GTPase-activating protein (RanGAP) involved in mRNA processing and transport
LNISSNNFNNLDEQSFSLLCNTLKQCKSLEQIYIDDPCNAVRFNSLCTALSSCTNLSLIYLDSNYLDRLNDKSFSYYCNALKKIKTLEELHISTNGLSSKRADELCKSLAQCQLLTTIGYPGINFQEKFDIVTNFHKKNILHVSKDEVNDKLPEVLTEICFRYMNTFRNKPLKERKAITSAESTPRKSI